MSPKEKAKNLVNKYLDNIPFADKSIERAKQCALIASDEVMIYLDAIMLPNPFKQYWNKVKHEINQL